MSTQQPRERHLYAVPPPLAFDEGLDAEVLAPPLPELRADRQLTPFLETVPNRTWGQKIRRWGGVALLYASVAFGAGTVGATMVGAESEAAGHEITTKANLSGYLSVKSGMLGSLHIPMENLTDSSYGFGAEVEIGEIQNIDENEIETYTSFLANIDPDVKDAREAMLRTFGISALIGVGGLFALSRSKILNPDHRQRLVNRLGSETRMRVALAAAILTPGLIMSTVDVLEEKPKANVSSTFDGTILENARATGWIKVLVNQFGSEGLRRIDAINRFSDETIKHLRKAAEDDPNPFNQAKGTVNVIGFGGLKCNPSMMPVIGETLDLYDAAFAVSVGDDVLGQKDLDGLCLDRLVSQTKGTDILMSLGNHRTSATRKQAEALGITVLKKGEIIKKNGLTVSGAPDPYRHAAMEAETADSGFSARIVLGNEISDISCKQEKQVSIVPLNQQRAAEVVARNGCASVVMAGGIEHSSETFSTDGSETTYLREKSAGGASYAEGNLNVVTLEPPKVDVDVYRYVFDKDTGKLLYWQAIIATPETDVVITSPRLTSFGSSAEGMKILLGS